MTKSKLQINIKYQIPKIENGFKNLNLEFRNCLLFDTWLLGFARRV